MKEIKFLTPQELKTSRLFFELKLPNVFLWFVFGVLLIILVFFAWTFFGEMDVVIKADAILLPKQKVSELISPVTGIVSQRFFSNGQKVKKGDLLWCLENENLHTDLKNTEKQLERTQLDLQNAQAVYNYMMKLKNCEVLTSEAKRLIDIIDIEQKRLYQKMKYTKWIYEKTKDVAHGSISKKDLLELENNYLTAKYDYEAYEKKNVQNYYEDINNLFDKLESLTQHLDEVKLAMANYEVVAPQDGTVQTYCEFNEGDVVVSETPICKIVPEKANDLKVRIILSTDEVAEIKKEMSFYLVFPKLSVSEFGTLYGHITFVPNDSQYTDSTTQVSFLEGELDSNYLKSFNGRKVYLKSGMNSTAYIITKRKKIYLFILEKLNFIYD